MKIKKECLICKKEYLTKASKVKSKYCSWKCLHKSRKGIPSWCKGLTKETDERLKKISETLKRNYKENPNIKCGFKKGTQMHLGRKLTEEHRRKIGLGVKSSPKWQENIKSGARSLKLSKALKGRIFSEEYKRKQSIAHKGKLMGDENPSKRPEVRKKISEKGMGRKNSKEQNDKMSRLWKQRWKTDQEYINKWRQSIDASPNKKETFLINFFKENSLPFEFVGDFKVNIGGSFPDFINKDKRKIIELFGNYWHKKEEEQQRINHFKDYGYECLVIWENELKDKASLLSKIVNFYLVTYR